MSKHNLEKMCARALALRLNGLLELWDEVGATGSVAPLIQRGEDERARRSLARRPPCKFRVLADFGFRPTSIRPGAGPDSAHCRPFCRAPVMDIEQSAFDSCSHDREAVCHLGVVAALSDQCRQVERRLLDAVE